MVITCGLCGTRVEEDRAQPACARCPIGAHCGLARCPACGYENPRIPSWLERLHRFTTTGRAGGRAAAAAGLEADASVERVEAS